MAAETEAKPPANADQEAGGGSRRSGNSGGGRGGYPRDTFKAPTVGYTQEIFSWNNSKSKAVKF